MKFKFATDPATEADIKAFEAEIEASLPDDYKTFLQDVNGGRPERMCFSPQWQGQSYANRYSLSTVSELFGLRDDEGLDLRDECENFDERIPGQTIPIGRDPGGNLIILVLNKDHLGAVHFWAMEHEVDFEIGEVPDFSNIAFLATSFSEFLNALEAES